MVIEVPNVGVWGGALFGCHRRWSKSRGIIRSARVALAARATAPACLAAVDRWLGGGLVKLVRELALTAAGPARRGEVVRDLGSHAGRG